MVLGILHKEACHAAYQIRAFTELVHLAWCTPQPSWHMTAWGSRVVYHGNHHNTLLKGCVHGSVMCYAVLTMQRLAVCQTHYRCDTVCTHDWQLCVISPVCATCVMSLGNAYVCTPNILDGVM